MLDFKTLQLNPLIAYSTLKPNSITNPINLSQKEIQIFDLFKEIIKEKKLENIELRVVGGWVRDHLLNVPCNDLDITIKGIDPKTFAELLNEKVNKGKYAIGTKPLKRSNGLKINLIKTKIYDTLIDFVELKETALEDAKRRDFTFNSLFYNILENKIEDLLKLGIDDLKNGFIRACYDSDKDINYNIYPVLRMLRFAVKKQFIIDDRYFKIIIDNKTIFQNELLNESLKEVIHKDICLIFTSPNPSFAIYSLYKLDLLKYALQIKPGYKNINKELFSDKDILICVNTFIVGNKVFDKYHSYFEGENFDDNYKCSFYSILLIIHLKYFSNRSQNVMAKMILGNVLKLKSKEFFRIVDIFDDFNNFFIKCEFNKLNVSILLRKILVRNITIMILISIAYDYVKKISPNEVLDILDYNILENIFQKYFEFFKYMKKEKLEKVDEIKSIIDAKRIKNEFPGITNNYIGELIDITINRQIETNFTLSEEDAINFLKKKFEEIQIKK